MNIAEQIMRRADRAFAEASGRTLIEDLGPEEQKAALEGDIESKARYVRTPAGVRRFKRPIGAIILPRGLGSLNQIRAKDPVFKGFDLVEDRKGNLYDVGKDDSTGKYVALKHNTWDDQIEPQDSHDKALEALNEKLGGGTNADKEEGEKPAPKTKKPAPKKTPSKESSNDSKPQTSAPSKGNTSTAEIVDGKFVITTPDGKKHTRTATGKKPYTHALIRKNKEGSGSDRYFVNFATDEGKVHRESRIGAADRAHNEIIELPTSGDDAPSTPEPQGDAPASDDNVASSDPRKRSAKFKRAADNMDRALDAVDNAKTEDDYRRALVDLEKSTVEMEDYIKSKGSEEDFARSALPKIERAKAKARSQIKRMEAKRKDQAGAGARDKSKAVTRDTPIGTQVRVSDEGHGNAGATGKIVRRNKNGVTIKGKDGTFSAPYDALETTSKADGKRIEAAQGASKDLDLLDRQASGLQKTMDRMEKAPTLDELNELDRDFTVQRARQRVKADEIIKNPRTSDEDRKRAQDAKDRVSKLDDDEIALLERKKKELSAPKPKATSKGTPGSPERDAFIESHPKIKDVTDYHKPKLRDMSEKNFEAYVAAVEGGKSPNSVGPIMDRIDAGASWNPTTEKWVGQNSTKRPPSPPPTGDTSAADAADAAVRDRVQKMKDADRSKGRTNPYTSSLTESQKASVDNLTPGQYAKYMNRRDAGDGHYKALAESNGQADTDRERLRKIQGTRVTGTPDEKVKKFDDLLKALDHFDKTSESGLGPESRKVRSRIAERRADALKAQGDQRRAEKEAERQRQQAEKSRSQVAEDAARNQKNREAREGAEAQEALRRKYTKNHDSHTGRMYPGIQGHARASVEEAQRIQRAGGKESYQPVLDEMDNIRKGAQAIKDSDSYWVGPESREKAERAIALLDQAKPYIEGLERDRLKGAPKGGDKPSSSDARASKQYGDAPLAADGLPVQTSKSRGSRATGDYIPALPKGKQKTYVITSPDGRTHLDNTSRAATHAVVVRESDGSWSLHSVNGSESAARKAALTYSNRNGVGSAQVVPSTPREAAQPLQSTSSGASEALKSEAGEYRSKARDLSKRIREALSDTTSQDEAYRDRLRALDAEYTALLPRNRQIQDAHFGSDKATQDELRGVANAAQEMGAERNRLATRLNGVNIALERQQSRRPQAKRPETTPTRPRETSSPAPAQERVKGVDSTVALAKTQAQKARRARTEKSARDHINTLNGTERDLNRNLERSGDRMPADQRAEVEQVLQEIRAARVKAEQNIPLRDRTHLRPADLPALREEAESRRYTIANPRVNAAVDLFNEIPSGTDLPNGRRYEQSVDMDDVYAMDNPPSVPELNRAIDALEKEGDGDYDDELWVLRTVRDNMKERIDRERAETEAANTSLFGDDLSIPEPTPAPRRSPAYTERPGDPGDGPFRRGADRLRRAGITEFTPNQARQVDEMKRDQWEAAQARVSAGESISDVLGSTATRNRRDPMAPPSVSRDEVQRRLAERRAARGAAPRPAGQSEDRTNKTAISIGNFGVRSETEARQMYANTPRRDIADIPKGGNGHIGNGIWVKRCPVCGQAFKSVGAPGYSATYARHVDGHNTGAAIPGYNTGMMS